MGAEHSGRWCRKPAFVPGAQNLPALLRSLAPSLFPSPAPAARSAPAAAFYPLGHPKHAPPATSPPAAAPAASAHQEGGGGGVAQQGGRLQHLHGKGGLAAEDAVLGACSEGRQL